MMLADLIEKLTDLFNQEGDVEVFHAITYPNPSHVTKVEVVTVDNEHTRAYMPLGSVLIE